MFECVYICNNCILSSFNNGIEGEIIRSKPTECVHHNWMYMSMTWCRMLESSYDLLFGKLALKCLFEDYFEEARHFSSRIMLKPIDDPHVDLVATVSVKIFLLCFLLIYLVLVWDWFFFFFLILFVENMSREE